MADSGAGGQGTACNDADHDRRQRRLLVGLAFLFFAPLAVSFYLYYGGDWRPIKHVNHGDLVNPARPLPEISLPIARDPGRAADGGAQTRLSFVKGKWTLLYWGAGSCSARCRTDLYNTRQIRTALNQNMDRVQRIFLAAGDCCDWHYLDHQHPDLLTLRATPAAAPLLALLPTYAGIEPGAADRVYLIDPLGNLMMSYAPDAKPKGMLEDLKRLLGLSSVG